MRLGLVILVTVLGSWTDQSTAGCCKGQLLPQCAGGGGGRLGRLFPSRYENSMGDKIR